MDGNRLMDESTYSGIESSTQSNERDRGVGSSQNIVTEIEYHPYNPGSIDATPELSPLDQKLKQSYEDLILFGEAFILITSSDLGLDD